jgi:hypothetical protein
VAVHELFALARGQTRQAKLNVSAGNVNVSERQMPRQLPEETSDDEHRAVGHTFEQPEKAQRKPARPMPGRK